MALTLDTELLAAIDAVRAAALACERVQRRLVGPETLQKKDKSPVTVADYASQAIVCACLEKALPGDLVVAEEDGAALRGDEPDLVNMRGIVTEQVIATFGHGKHIDDQRVLAWIDRGQANAAGGRYWTLDPIDGTKGFLRNEQYAVALALIEDGQVVLGALGCPNLTLKPGLGVLMIARRGQGAEILPLWDSEKVNRTPVRVSTVKNTHDARFCESVESGHSDQEASQQIAQTLGISNEPVRMDSQAKYATVARGEADIYLRLPTRADYREKIWDHAAGMLIVQESGGRVTDVDGKPLDFTHGRQLEHNRGIIATNGTIHDAVLAAVGKAL
jgi:3'(2'), 5'-bisphosphate nucleotidase